MRRRPAPSAGFTFVEVLVATALLATGVIFLVNMMVGTARFSRKTQDALFEAVISHQIFQSLKDHITIDPDGLAHLERIGFSRNGSQWIAWGTPVALVEPLVSPDGQPVPQLAFFKGIFNVGGGLADAKSQGLLAENLSRFTSTPNLTQEELAAIARSYKNYAVRIAIWNIEAAMPIEAATLSGGELKELLKAVTIEVYPVAELRTRRDTRPTYVYTGRVVTAVESLSDAAIVALDGQFANPGYEAALAFARRDIAEDPRFRSSSPAAVEILARIFVIFQAANLETFQTEGRGMALLPVFPRKSLSIHELIDRLQPSRDPAVRAMLAETHFREAVIVMAAFKRSRQAMEDLQGRLIPEFERGLAEAQRRLQLLGVEATRVASGLEETSNRIDNEVANLQGGAVARLPDAVTLLPPNVDRYLKLEASFREEIERDSDLLAQAMLYEYLINSADIRPVLQRFADYPDRVVGSISKGLNTLKANLDDPGLTARRTALDTATWADAQKALRIVERQLNLPADAARILAALRQKFEGRAASLSAFLAEDLLVAPLPSLEQRSLAFASVREGIEKLKARTDAVSSLIAKLGPGGEIAKDLDRIGAVPAQLYHATLKFADVAASVDNPAVRSAGVDVDSITGHSRSFTSNLGEPFGKLLGMGITDVPHLRTGKAPTQLTRQRVNAGREPPRSGLGWCCPQEGQVAPGSTRPEAGR